MGEIFEYVLPKTALAWIGGRLTKAVGDQVQIEQLHRYIMARDFCRGLDVLDIASGEGYGTALLAQVAKSATGVDDSAEAVDNAQSQFDLPNLRFLQGHGSTIPLPDASIDVVVSFGTIERFYDQDQFIDEIKRVLRMDGLLVVSALDPDQPANAEGDANPFHRKELSRSEFLHLLQSHYKNVSLFRQRTMVGSVLMSDRGEIGSTVTVERRGAKHFERSEGMARSPYLVAFATDAPLPSLSNSLYVANAETGPLLARAAEHPALTAALTNMRSRAEAAEKAALANQAELAKSMDDAKASPISDERFAAVLAERDAAFAHRDAARFALRRASIPPGARLLAVSDARVDALKEDIRNLDARVAAAERNAQEWKDRYHRLRGRLERLYVRSGLFYLFRLVPRSVRQSVGKSVLVSRD